MTIMVDSAPTQPFPYFRYVHHAPTGHAGQLVRRSWTMEAERCRTAVEAALPDGALEIYFNLGPAGRRLAGGGTTSSLAPRSAWIVGPRDHPLLIEKEVRDCDIVCVRLHPGTAMQVLGVPACEVRSSMLDLELFWGAEVGEVREQLQGTPEPAARLAIAERAVARRLAHRLQSDEASLARALCGAVDTPDRASVGEIAARSGLTHRRVIALFDRAVGLKPKAFHRVQRLRRVFRLVDEAPRPSWTSIAHRAGYFDQAHLINDFKALTGLSPAEYASTHSSVGRGFVPHRLVTQP
jgi:AraC-like DNA-binding protein